MAEDDFEDASAGIRKSRSSPEALALGAALGSPETAEEAKEYLRLQSRLAELQIENTRLENDNLRKLDEYEVSHLRWRRFNDQMKGTLQILLVTFGLLVVVLVGAAIWNASQFRGLIAEPLKTPPDFAARGLDGTLLSQRLLDRLTARENAGLEYALAQPDAISGSWGSDSKVQIPDTGVSIDEAWRLLRSWLGHETRVSGEVWHTKNGIALNVRAAGNAGETFTGSEGELDALLDKAADSLLNRTQPGLYNVLLYQDGKYSEAEAQALARTRTGSVPDRAEAYGELADALSGAGNNRAAIEPYARSIALAPGDPTKPFFAVNVDISLDHAQAFAEHASLALREFETGAPSTYRPDVIVNLTASARAMNGEIHGDFLDAVQSDRAAESIVFSEYETLGGMVTAADLARDHDDGAARAILNGHSDYSDGRAVILIDDLGAQLPVAWSLVDAGDWSGMRASLSRADRAALASGVVNDARHTLVWPWLAYALAKTGDQKDAEDIVRLTPLDCTRCLEFRGRVAEAAGQGAVAARWYARATTDAPAEPFAVTDWGAMLLEEGKFAAAIEKFRLANEKAPHFADPLEMWGEALIRENRSDLALVRFSEAARYAPNWGRLRLKWGEALLWTGDKAGAATQFALAVTLDLTPAEQSELARMKGIHG